MREIDKNTHSAAAHLRDRQIIDASPRSRAQLINTLIKNLDARTEREIQFDCSRSTPSPPMNTAHTQTDWDDDDDDDQSR